MRRCHQLVNIHDPEILYILWLLGEKAAAEWESRHSRDLKRQAGQEDVLSVVIISLFSDMVFRRFMRFDGGSCAADRGDVAVLQARSSWEICCRACDTFFLPEAFGGPKGLNYEARDEGGDCDGTGHVRQGRKWFWSC